MAAFQDNSPGDDWNPAGQDPDASAGRRPRRTAAVGTVLLEQLVRVTGSLGLGSEPELDQDGREWAIETAVQRFRAACDTPFAGEPWQELIVCREYIKVLAGGVFAKPIREAHRSNRDEGASDLAAQVFRQLEPGGNAVSDLGSFLDPRQWDLSTVVASDRVDRLLRLSFIATALLTQEKGFEQASMSLEAAARLASAGPLRPDQR